MIKRLKKFYEDTYTHGVLRTWPVFLVLFVGMYPIISGELLLHFGKVISTIYFVIYYILLLAHAVCLLKNWRTILSNYEEDEDEEK